MLRWSCSFSTVPVPVADLDKTDSEEEASGSDDEGGNDLPNEEDEGIPGALEDDMRYLHHTST